MKTKHNRTYYGRTLSQVGMLACCIFIFSVLFSSASASIPVTAPSSPSAKKALPMPEVKKPPSPTKPKDVPKKPEAKPTTGVPIPPTTPSITTEDCSRVRKKYVALNFPLDSVAGAPIPGTGLTICNSASYTCCTPKMERRLQEGVAQNVRQTVRSVLRKAAVKLEHREMQLLKFLHRMLNSSYVQLNKMFMQTYGLHYNQNSQLFVNFYKRMHNYLNGKEDNISQIVDGLFKDMGSTMISMLWTKDRMTTSNYQWRFPRKTILDCLEKNFHGAQAYGTGPDTIKKNLIRSLTAGRNLAMTLAVQRETLARVIKKMLLVPECMNALTRINSCSLCSGHTDSRPCPNFCSNVIRGCFAQIYQFSDKWLSLSKAALKLATLLEGRNNLVYTFESTIAVKLSESITNFQTNFQQGKNKIYSKCRGSPYGRVKRTVRPRKGVPEVSPHRSRILLRTRRATDFQNLRTEFKRLLSNLKSHVLVPQTNLWQTATEGLCRDGPFYASIDPRRCWNGTAIGPYEGALVPANIKGQVENPEVAVDVSRVKTKATTDLAWLLREAQQRVASAIIEREVPGLVFTRTDLGRPPSLPTSNRRDMRPGNAGAKTGANLGVEGSGEGERAEKLPSRGWPERVSGSGDSPLPSRPEPKKVASTPKPPRTPIDDDDTEEPTGDNRKVPGGGPIGNLKPPSKGLVSLEGSGASGDGPLRPPSRPKPETGPKPESRPVWPNKKPAPKKENRWPERLPETRPKTPQTNRDRIPSQRRPTGDDEDAEGSGRQSTWDRRGKGMEGSGSYGASGDRPLPDNQPIGGRNINNWPDRPEDSYPSRVWVPKKVIAENPEPPAFGDYTVQTETGPRRSDRCTGPGCNGAVGKLVNNFLLLLTVAVLSAALFV